MDRSWNSCRGEESQNRGKRKNAANTAVWTVKKAGILAMLGANLCSLNVAAASGPIGDGQIWTNPYDGDLIRYVYIYDYNSVEYSTLSAACGTARIRIQSGIDASYPENPAYMLSMHPYPDPALSVSISDQYALYDCQAFFQLKFVSGSVQEFEFNEQVGRRIKTCRVGQRLTIANELCENLEPVPLIIGRRLIDN